VKSTNHSRKREETENAGQKYIDRSEPEKNSRGERKRTMNNIIQAKEIQDELNGPFFFFRFEYTRVHPLDIIDMS
jgi:hypothetical protein